MPAASVWWSIHLMSRFYQARKETLDLERDVCRSRNLSLHMVPYKLKVTTERSLCTTSCYTPIFSFMWFTVWPWEPAHVHQVVWRGCAVQQEREVWLNCPPSDGQVPCKPPICCMQGLYRMDHIQQEGAFSNKVYVSANPTCPGSIWRWVNAWQKSRTANRCILRWASSSISDLDQFFFVDMDCQWRQQHRRGMDELVYWRGWNQTYLPYPLLISTIHNSHQNGILTSDYPWFSHFQF